MPTPFSRPALDASRVLVLADRIPRPGLRLGDHRLLQLLTELSSLDPRPRITLLVADWCATAGPDEIVRSLGIEVVSHAPDWEEWFAACPADLVVIHGSVAARRFRPLLDVAHAATPRVVDSSAIEGLDGRAPLAPLDGDDEGRAILVATSRADDEALLVCADAVWCASDDEAAQIRALAPTCPITVLRGHTSPASSTVPPSMRRDVAMVGSFVEGVCSPDEDAAMFLACDVMPRVRLHADVTLHVFGEDASPVVRALGDGVRFHAVRGTISSSLCTVRAVISVRRFGRGTSAAPFVAAEAGAPLIAGGRVADALDLPSMLRVDDDVDALVEAISTCVVGGPAWVDRAQATEDWTRSLSHSRYRAALLGTLDALGASSRASKATPTTTPIGEPGSLPWAGRTHGRTAPDPAHRVAPTVAPLDLALADQVTTSGVPDPESLLTFPLESPYHEWIRARDPSPRQRWANDARVASLPYRPLVSLVVGVHNTSPEAVATTIESIRAQRYPRWEVCIADDGSTDLETLAALTDAAESDRRVHLVRLGTPEGEAVAKNSALRRARGEFVGFVDPGEMLEPLTLLEVVDLLNRVPDLDVVYTDEHDYEKATGRRINPSLKPSWSPDLLRSTNYVGQLVVFRRAVVERLGGLRPELVGALGYDLVLRVTGDSDRVGHVAQPLFRTDVDDRRTADSGDAARRALEAAVARAGERAEVEELAGPGTFRVRYSIIDMPRVDIVIATRDRGDLLATAIRSIRDRSTYRNFEISIIDNQSRDPGTLAMLERHDGPVLRYDAPFNYARMMNLAIARTDGDLLLLLNNDIEVHQPDWIEGMVEHAQRTTVGAVGVRLAFPSGAAQHQGILVGGGGGATNLDFDTATFDGEDSHFVTSLGRLVANFSAVTAACVMARPAVLAEVGGFDERLHVAFNDVDLCLKLRARGYEIVCTPFVSVVHEESATRGALHPMENDDRFRTRWRADGRYEDPYSNPNYDQHRRFALNPTWETSE